MTQQRKKWRLADRARTGAVAVKELPLPAKGAKIYYDDEVPGFGCKVTQAGGRTYVLNYSTHGHERRLTIGPSDAWTASAARERAKELRRLISLGRDPLAERQGEAVAVKEEREAPTLADLFARYDREHATPNKALRSAKDERSMWRTYILPKLGRIKVKDLGPSDCDGLHASITAAGKPVRANRVQETLHKALSLAVRWGWTERNAAAGVRENLEQPRQRYLKPSEIKALLDSLDAQEARLPAAAIKMMIFTGARRGEVLAAQWADFDLEAAVWTKPAATTKQRKLHRVPLNSAAVNLLRQLKAAAGADEALHASPWVFPGSGASGHIVDVKRTWAAVCADAGLAKKVRRELTRQHAAGPVKVPVEQWEPTVRLHDLRHSFASAAASNGATLPVIGALLGHTQAQTTLRYAHLMDDPLRQAAESVASAATTYSA